MRRLLAPAVLLLAAAVGRADPPTADELQAWIRDLDSPTFRTRDEAARKRLAGPGPEGRSAHEQQLAAWEQEREAIEAELAREIPEMNLEQKLRAADRRAVARALPERVALVEFVRFDECDFHAEKL